MHKGELQNAVEFLLPLFLVALCFMQDLSHHSIVSQSQVLIYEKYITAIYALCSAHEGNAI